MKKNTHGHTTEQLPTMKVVASTIARLLALSASLSFSTAASAFNDVEPNDAPPVIPVPISVGDIFFIVYADGPYLPKDPGDNGDASIAGIDSDGDGVRDDLERYIARSYPNDRQVRNALYLQARGTQELIVSSQTPAQINAATNKVLNAKRCLEVSVGDRAEARSIKKELMIKHLNTIDRLRANLATGKIMDGMGMVVQRSPCNWGDL